MSNSSSAEIPLRNIRQGPVTGEIIPAGIPCRKGLFYVVDALVIATSYSCLAVAFLVLQNDELAWHLRFKGQLIVIGFTLGIMNLCLQTTLPYAFLLLETCFGPRSLQNYQAINTGSALTAHASWIWRLLFVFNLALPLGLSVAYKTFLGGESSRNLQTESLGRYGLSSLGNDRPPPFSDSLNFAIPVLQAYRTGMEGGNGENTIPEPAALPMPYGYNLLLLSHSSAAILDVPSIDYVLEMQSRIRLDESWLVSAKVHAYIVNLDAETERYRSSDAYWDEIKDSVLYTTYLYHALSVQSRIGWVTTPEGIWFGSFDSNEYGGTNHYSLAESGDSSLFRANASLYSIHRAQCHGTWQFNTTFVNTLRNGACYPEQIVDQNVTTAQYSTPDPVDALPALKGSYAHERNDWLMSHGWLNATAAMGVGISYWARAIEMLVVNPEYELFYNTTEETIVSTRAALRNDVGLYLVLATLPFLHTAAFLVTIWLRSVPIGRGFGIISLLAGFETAGQALLRGAGFSGSLKRRLTLGVSQERRSGDIDGMEKGNYCAQYSISDVGSQGKHVARMKIGEIYE